jgi:hypothetical protein
MERTRMSIRQPQQTRNASKHAVVIGASMAGLLAGRVLSEHFEQMSRFPEGLVILGDAACSINPIYGQGMTTAALDASTLNDCLCQRLRNAGGGNPIRLTQHCQQAIAKMVKAPWLLATSEDFHYPETIGKRPKGMHLLNWYIRKFHVLVGSYPLATLRFYEVLHMLKPPITLFEPDILFAVFFKRRFTLRGHEFDKR